VKPLFADKALAPDWLYYHTNTFWTSEKKTSLYSKQRTATMPQTDLCLYKFNSQSRQWNRTHQLALYVGGVAPPIWLPQHV